MNNKITEYKTVTADSLPQMEEVVKNYIFTGWQPMGGITVRTYMVLPEVLYIQTMVKYE